MHGSFSYERISQSDERRDKERRTDRSKPKYKDYFYRQARSIKRKVRESDVQL